MKENETSTDFITVRGLRKRFGKQRVLNGVDLEIPSGETTVILGSSGTGKSVLLKHFNGLLRPDSGTVKVCGTEIGDLSERELGDVRRRIGILFQDGALFDSMRVGENVAFPLRETGERDNKVIAEKVAAALEKVGLFGEEDKRPSKLSGGMRKRAALARAIVVRPQCLLYDEPTTGLDPLLSATISELIQRMKTEFSLTSVVVTHDLSVMRAVADRVIFLDEGRVSFSGTISELEESEDESIAAFLKAGGFGDR